MITFTEYIQLMEEIKLEEDFEFNGRKFTISDGKYYCDGRQISKIVYQRALAQKSQESSRGRWKDSDILKRRRRINFYSKDF
jgi:hypothetical protein